MSRAALVLPSVLAALCFSTLAWPFNTEAPPGARGNAGRFRPPASPSSSVAVAPDLQTAPVSVIPSADPPAPPAPPRNPAEEFPVAASLPWPSFRVGLDLMFLKVPQEMLGNAPGILTELGLLGDRPSSTTMVPRLHLSTELRSGRNHSLGLDFGASWLSSSVSSAPGHPVDYEVSRTLVPLDAQGRFLAGSPRISFFMAGGLSLGLAFFREKGWLGEKTGTDPFVGAVLRTGLWIRMNPHMHLSLGLIFQGYTLPRMNPLISDGGGAQSTGGFVGVDFGP